MGSPLNLVPADAATNADTNARVFAPSVESTLGFADGTPNDELRARLLTATRYCASWFQAVQSGDAVSDTIVARDNNSVMFSQRIADVLDEITATLAQLPPDGLFPGNDAVAAYNQTSADFAQLYRDLALSADSLPRPDLLTQLGDIGSAFLNAPVAAAKTLAEQIADAIRKLLGNTAAAVWHALWPWLLVAGAAGAVYVFRRPLGRALGKVAS